MSRRARSAAGGSVSLAESLADAGLSKDVIAEMAALPHRVVEVDPRRPFREAGIPRDEVFFVTSGILAKFKADGAGRRQIVALRFAGEGILPCNSPAEYGIQAIVGSEVLIGAQSDLEKIVDRHPEVAKVLYRHFQRHSSISDEWLVNCGRRDSTARVAHLLCETAERSGIGDDIERMVNPFTQQQIADITGQTSVNVNRVFADLERQGLIGREGREIVFRDWSEMRRLASFNPNYLQ